MFYNFDKRYITIPLLLLLTLISNGCYFGKKSIVEQLQKSIELPYLDRQKHLFGVEDGIIEIKSCSVIQKENPSTYLELQHITILGINFKCHEHPIRLYFDGKEQSDEKSKNYISFGEDSIFISQVKGISMFLTFLTDNPYVPVEKNDYLGMELKEAQILLGSRQKNNKIPRIMIRTLEKKEGIVHIRDGRITATIEPSKKWCRVTEDNALVMENDRLINDHKHSSVPIQIYLSEEKVWKVITFSLLKESLSGSADQTRVIDSIIINNYDQVGTYPTPYNPDFRFIHISSSNVVSDKLEPENTKVYSLLDFKKDFSNINIEGEVPESSIIKRLIDLLNDVKPKTLVQNLKKIRIVPYLKMFGDKGENNVAAYAGPNEINIAQESFVNPSNFIHELAHVRTFYLEKTDFKTRWLNIVGNVYLKYVCLEPQEKIFKWCDAYNKDIQNLYDSPQYGFAEPYGDKDFMEDVATICAKWTTNWSIDSSKLIPLITVGGKYYHPNYYKKLELLEEVGFITGFKNQYKNFIYG